MGKKENIVISKNVRKEFDKIQYSFMIKTLSKLGKEGNYINIIIVHIWKTTANIILSGERLEAFPLRSEKRQKYLYLPFLFNIVLAVLARAISQQKEIKDIQIEKK